MQKKAKTLNKNTPLSKGPRNAICLKPVVRVYIEVSLRRRVFYSDVMYAEVEV